MDKSILTEVKKILGLDESYEAFDGELVVHVNSALFSLCQLGVGKEDGLSITDKTTTWEALEIPQDKTTLLSAAKQYVALKVRQRFDPPTSSYVLQNNDEAISELEWRMEVMTRNS